MAIIGYHASHEQFAPGDLLDYVQLAQQAGFEAGMCSDHSMPWSERQGQSGFSFAWLGAALQATDLSYGVVCSPGQRHHPAIVAQAAATLSSMFPARFWIALGSGQLMNEHITGDRWPSKPERQERLRECVDIIRALLAGDTVSHRGLVRVDEAKLWTRPDDPPQLIGAAISPATAEWIGGWADGLITVAKQRNALEETIDAFRRGGGENKPMYLQAQVSWADSDAAARRQAHDQWRTNIFPSNVQTELRMPADFDAAAAHLREEDLEGSIRVSADLERHVEWLRGDVELGFAGIYLHNVGRNQEAFIEAFGHHVLPHLE
ncbi:TIGR03885 family FMN-dependent LLM class oxidoreductase [soil metagenome]